MTLQPKAVLETSLYVSDVERAVEFYQNVLGLRKIEDGYFAGGRGAALQVGTGPSVLLLFRGDITRQGGMLPAHGTIGAGHAAFRIEAEEISAWRERFRDPDGNSLELAVASIWAFGKA